MRNMKSVSLLLALITISLIFTVNVSANSGFYSSVQQICNAYQVSIEYERMNLAVLADGNKEFTMSVKSARNQFDRIMLIVFYAAGKAMTYHNEPIQKVTVVVSVEYKGIENIVASASRENILKFVNGEINSSEFVRKVKFD
ncbi:hypothetical protein KJ762_10700 [bacterium]|nr:hypothetical protein [bacterium]MBU1065012.1 hypothetical protein [bacterium]MBU1634964.1 hypothetical protein [bacterium]MBU1872780.1 hypothetical protein [bacterium]